MSSAKLVLPVLALIHISTSSWWITKETEWTSNIQADCPREDPQTHVCFSLQVQTGMCTKVRCYGYIIDTQSYVPDFIFTPVPCSMTYKTTPCSVYQCYSRCCDGYEPDILGRCQNKTGKLECQNGGTLQWDEWENFYCDCLSGFRGRSCEKPICNCDNMGECIVKDGSPYCKCKDIYYGQKCEHSRCNKTCENGGTCYRENMSELCKCPYPYVGQRCEILYDKPISCPKQSTYGIIYTQMCTSDSGCPAGTTCCFYRHETMCQLIPTCNNELDEGLILKHEVHDHCKNCTCVGYKHRECDYQSCPDRTCKWMSCPYRRCHHGNKTVYIRPNCCQTCIEAATQVTRIYDCPKLVHVKTQCNSDVANLTRANVGIKAMGDTGKKIQEVTFQPSLVKHCHCVVKPPVEVVATITDEQGISMECWFSAIVGDDCAPRFQTCPNNIYVFDDEPVHWTVPAFYDNVAIGTKKYSGNSNHKFYPVGSHKIKYFIEDFDDNSAICIFSVHVVRRGTPISLMPRGLIVRSLEIKHNLLQKFLIPLIISLPVLIFATMLVMWYRCNKVDDQLASPGTSPECDDASVKTCDKHNEEHPSDNEAGDNANNKDMEHFAGQLPRLDYPGVHTN